MSDDDMSFHRNLDTMLPYFNLDIQYIAHRLALIISIVQLYDVLGTGSNTYSSES